MCFLRNKVLLIIIIVIITSSLNFERKTYLTEIKNVIWGSHSLKQTFGIKDNFDRKVTLKNVIHHHQSLK